MLVVLSKALAFVLIILIGYICKRRGFFSPTDYQVISKIVLNITLPCAVINSFAHFEMDFSLIVAVFLGLFGNLMMLFVSLMLTRGDTPATKIFYIFSLAGYNIGCFTLPFAQAFFTPFAMAFPKPVSGTFAPAPAQSASGWYIPSAPSITPATT